MLNGKLRRETYVLLGCEGSDKYIKHISDLTLTLTNIRKCVYGTNQFIIKNLSV